MESVIETDRFSVDDDQIDFGVRNGEGFDRIFDGRMAIKFVTERILAWRECDLGLLSGFRKPEGKANGERRCLRSPFL